MTSSDDPSWDAEVAQLAGTGPASVMTAYLRRLPAGYRAITSPPEAIEDQAVVSRLEAAEGPPGWAPAPEGGPPLPGSLPLMGASHQLVVRPSHDRSSTFRLRRFGAAGIELTTTLPLLESFGLVVVEAVPMRLAPAVADGTEIHVDDIGLRADAPYGPEALRFVAEVHGDRLVDAIEACAHGRADVDSLNRLVTAAGLDWRQVMVLRAYLRYWRQSGVALSWAQMTDPLVAYPDVARALVGYFEARFDPDAADGPGPAPG
ncbi:MAG: NAD-glutamate dehydrogenase, partial [Actinomycetota bacterium]|nr:NAD-glutamate dehydrogenase [Actinomycetota bacterium]